ncbi:acyltransferase [Aliidongia dinghuensis]|uniref:Acyltransferase n=1 Tax=Aliidongia dinghuensis TaxID=1867774 RepID=A0A8J2YUL6_9PROT|nr:acyltransferase [Aliidongia dinghuensis]GGF17222.1 acyltransferase [Aliidongia dinghuensis]
MALDGLRGVAAISVVIFHYSGHLGYRLLPHASLAVDFFFALSGFVIAHAYERRLREGQRFGDFMRRRLVRLYPLFWIGMTLPLVELGLAAVLRLPHLNSAGALAAYLCGLLFLPVPSVVSPFPGFIYPLNDPAWSLSLEVAVNALYALWATRLTDGRLVALLAAAAVALVAAALFWGGLEIGNSWSTYLGGWSRVLWSFFAGILLYRLYRRRPHGTLGVRTGALLALVVLVLFAMPGTGPWFGLLSALAVFPAIIWIGATVKLTGRAAGLAHWLGTTSYALYITHLPVLGLVLLACREFGVAPEAAFLPSLVAAVLGAVAVAWLLDGIYDIPIRRWLAARGRRPQAPALVVAEEQGR